jgi:hypothetical protein
MSDRFSTSLLNRVTLRALLFDLLLSLLLRRSTFPLFLASLCLTLLLLQILQLSPRVPITLRGFRC